MNQSMLVVGVLILRSPFRSVQTYESLLHVEFANLMHRPTLTLRYFVELPIRPSRLCYDSGVSLSVQVSDFSDSNASRPNLWSIPVLRPAPSTVIVSFLHFGALPSFSPFISLVPACLRGSVALGRPYVVVLYFHTPKVRQRFVSSSGFACLFSNCSNSSSSHPFKKWFVLDFPPTHARITCV